MSSLAVSLLLLLLVAIVVVVGYNLRQGAGPRGQRLRDLARELGVRVRDVSRGASRRRETPAARDARHAAEPRLGRDAPGVGAAVTEGSAGDASQGASAAPWNGEPDDFSAGCDRDPAVGETTAAAHAPDAVDAADDPLHAPGASPGASARPREPEPGPMSGAALDTAAPTRATAQAPAGPAAGRAAQTAFAAAAPVEGGVAVEAPARTAAGPTAPRGPAISEACDCIVELAPASACPGERLAMLAQRFRRAGSKPVALEARRAGAGSPDTPEAPAAGRSYDAIRIGILLANRHGPLNAMEFSEFVNGVQTLAEALSARPALPAMGSVLARARDLDSTCAQLDAQIGVNVEAPEAIEPAQLAALASPLSLVERGSHRYVRPGAHGEPLFSVGFADSPSRLTFLLDVPRVAASLGPFARMLEAADGCAQRLGAKLVDDGGRPLTQAALAQIARQLEQRYESLEAIGLPAGSTLALKVFN